MAIPKPRARKPTSKKVAVDSTAVDYWSKYFEEYGDMMTRDIPRRIEAGLTSAVQRRASKGGGSPPQLVRAELAPKGKSCRRNAKGQIQEVRAEGVFRGVFKEGGREKTVRRFFHAVFNGQGEMTSLESVAVG
jgi:hypothetical protein